MTGVTNHTAYKSDDPIVLDAWEGYLRAVEETRKNRVALSESVGRQLWVNRIGFSHGTCVVGFDKFDHEKPGDLIDFNGGKSLRVYKNGMVKPNLRSAAGKKFAEELRTYDSPTLALPGLPNWHISGEGGLNSQSPGVFAQDGVVYAHWGCSDAPMNLALWTWIPLSEFFTAKEKFDAKHK